MTCSIRREEALFKSDCGLAKMTVATSTAKIEEDGFVWARDFVPPSILQDLENGISEITGRTRAGVRDLLRKCPPLRAFAQSSLVVDCLSELLNGQPFPVRGILFNKTPEANWRVAWHQDLTIAVCEPRDAPGFGPWSMKEGIAHVQPPSAMLERMLTLRLHLDDCEENSGALRVIAGSHRHGKLSAARINEWKRRSEAITCDARRGDALIMRPLLLHASSAAITPRQRRVIHLEFATDNLPNGLAWSEGIQE